MQEKDLDHLLVVTDHRSGNAPQWLTGWPGTVEAYVVFRPGAQMTMHVEWYNHFPAGEEAGARLRRALGRASRHRQDDRGAEKRAARRVGLIGPLLPRKKEKLKDFQVVDLDAEYVRLRLDQVRGGDRLAAHRRRDERRGIRSIVKEHQAGDDRARPR
jgi:hypothetical protein